MKFIGRSIIAFCVAVVGAATQAKGQLPTTITVGTMVRIHHPRTVEQHSVARVLRIRGDSLDLSFSGYPPSGRPYIPRGMYTDGQETVLWSDVDIVVGFDSQERQGFQEGLIGGPIAGAMAGLVVGVACVLGCFEHAQIRKLVGIGAGVGLVIGPIQGAMAGSQRRTLRWGPATGVESVAIEPAFIQKRPSLTVSVPF